MSERFLSDLLREAPRPRHLVHRRRYLMWLAVPVTLAAAFGVWAILVDGRWATGLGFLGVAMGVGWVFGSAE